MIWSVPTRRPFQCPQSNIRSLTYYVGPNCIVQIVKSRKTVVCALHMDNRATENGKQTGPTSRTYLIVGFSVNQRLPHNGFVINSNTEADQLSPLVGCQLIATAIRAQSAESLTYWKPHREPRIWPLLEFLDFYPHPGVCSTCDIR